MNNKTLYKEKVNSFVPYLATLYYIEIIYFMIFINFLYGKITAVSLGLLLTALLTFHVVKLFNKSNINRIIQLYLMDIHFAYSLAYFFNRVFSGNSIGSYDSFVLSVRIITACFEIITVFILTDRLVRSGYTD